MALQIKQSNDMLEVLGDLTSENAMTLKKHFEQFLKEADTVILNLENVDAMERESAFTMEQLYIDFMKSNKAIHIIGKTNQNITGIMNDTKTSYILSDDRI